MVAFQYFLNGLSAKSDDKDHGSHPAIRAGVSEVAVQANEGNSQTLNQG
jgi:hypothetical protein